MSPSEKQAIILHYAGRAGDHNDNAMHASPEIAFELSAHFNVEPIRIGHQEPALNVSWDEELQAARPSLSSFAAALDQALSEDKWPVIALSRCAVALATLPVISKHHPDAVVVWFDAHADINTPENTETGYLGGLALSGPMGLWDSGLGKGIKHAVLAGTRDIDPSEQVLIDQGAVELVSPGAEFAKRLAAVVRERPVYVHLDCDVLEPGQVPTDYHVPFGLTLAELQESMDTLAATSKIIGVEIGELEAGADLEETRAAAQSIIKAVSPLFRA